MSTFVELEKQVQQNAVLARRIADLEAQVQRLKTLNRKLRGLLPCATCNGSGIVYPPAIFAEPVPESAGETCLDCMGYGTDGHAA